MRTIADVAALVFALTCSERAAVAQESGEPPATREVVGGHFAVRAGATYRHLLDIPVYGVDLGLSFGRWGERGADFFSMEPFFGRTQYGLTTRIWAFRYRTDWLLGRVYAGFSPGLGVITVHRATDGRAMSGLGISLAGYAGWDFLRVGGSATSIELALSGDAYGVPSWAASLALVHRS